MLITAEKMGAEQGKNKPKEMNTQEGSHHCLATQTFDGII